MMANTTFGQTQSQRILQLFWKMLSGGRLHRLWARISRHNTHLLELDEQLCCSEVQNSHYAGVRSINIDRIRGTEGKSDAFDDDFHPLKEESRDRWLSVAREKIEGHSLPPVELIDVGGTYYVRDGHHRISVARSLGESFIDAEVIVMDLSSRIR